MSAHSTGTPKARPRSASSLARSVGSGAQPRLTRWTRAFWLEDEAGAGMFYTSFRFVERER